MKESSSEMSTLAAQVLNWPPKATATIGDAPPIMDASSYDRLLEIAKRLAGSVLSQDETPQPRFANIAAVGDLDGALVEKPAPNAPEPSVMREEMINSVIAKGYGKVQRGMAAKMVDDILERQMRFYSQMADPELTASPMEQMQIVADTQGIINALISVGAQGVEHMTADVRAKWQRLATRARELNARMAEMFS